MSYSLLSRLVFVFLLLAGMSTPICAQPPAPSKPVDLGALIKELMILDFVGNQSQTAIWMPHEFFVEAALNEGLVTRMGAEKNLEYLKPFTTLLVQNSIEKADGTDVYADEKEVRARAVLKLANGAELRPLDDVPPNVLAMIAEMKKAITAEGDAGRLNTHILVFPFKTTQGEKIVDVFRKDKLTLLLKGNARFSERVFTWRTPFDSMVAVPDCPRCKAGVSAKWSYCPYCGQKLPH